MKPRLQPRSILVLRHATAFCAPQGSFQIASSHAECCSYHAAHTKPDSISNRTVLHTPALASRISHLTSAPFKSGSQRLPSSRCIESAATLQCDSWFLAPALPIQPWTASTDFRPVLAHIPIRSSLIAMRRAPLLKIHPRTRQKITINGQNRHEGRTLPEASELHPCSSTSAGRVKEKLAPRGRLSEAHNRPPCDSIMERLIRSPMPVP